MTTDMPPATLSELVRNGFAAVAASGQELPHRNDDPALMQHAPRDLPALMHDRRILLAYQDELLAAVVRCYRRAPHSGWSGVLLEMLSPMLVAVGRRLTFVPESLAHEDVDHQLLAEALYIARTFALPRSGRYVQRWLEARLLRRMTQWLSAMNHGHAESLEEVNQEELVSHDATRLSMQGLADTGIPHADLVLLYRSHVLGMTARELAVEMGIPVADVTSRRRRANRLLRSRAPALFRRSSGGISAVA